MKNFNICGLIGRPLKHSYSPLIHNTAFCLLKLNYFYNLFEIEKTALARFVSAARVLNLKGFNVTVPYKCDIIKYLDSVEEDAARVKAVNTVINANGKLKGYNTDIYGFIKNLKINKVSAAGKNILLLGAGGAARAVIYSCLKLNASSISVFDIDLKKARVLKNFFNTDKIILLKKENLKSLNTYGIIINATPCGLKKNETPLPDFKKSNPNKKCAVYDLIYNPSRTLLMSQAQNAGLKAFNGLDMLLYQAAKSFEIWTSRKMPVAKVKNTLLLKLK